MTLMSEIFARALPCILYFVAAAVASVISTEEALDNSLDEDNDDHCVILMQKQETLRR